MTAFPRSIRFRSKIHSSGNVNVWKDKRRIKKHQPCLIRERALRDTGRVRLFARIFHTKHERKEGVGDLSLSVNSDNDNDKGR